MLFCEQPQFPPSGAVQGSPRTGEALADGGELVVVVVVVGVVAAVVDGVGGLEPVTVKGLRVALVGPGEV